MNRLSIELISDLEVADLKCEDLLKASSPIGLDCEGVELGRPDGELTLIQIVGQDSKVLLFDVFTCPEILTGKLKTLLEIPTIVKIAHDCRGDRVNLKAQFDINLQPVFDTQIAHKIIYNDNFRVGWNKLCQLHNLPKNPLKLKFHGIFNVNKSFWKIRPMTQEMIQYAAYDVIHLSTMYKRMDARINGGKRFEFELMCKEATFPANQNISFNQF